MRREVKRLRRMGEEGEGAKEGGRRRKRGSEQEEDVGGVSALGSEGVRGASAAGVGGVTIGGSAAGVGDGERSAAPAGPLVLTRRSSHSANVSFYTAPAVTGKEDGFLGVQVGTLTTSPLIFT